MRKSYRPRKSVKVRSSRGYLLQAVAYLIENGAEVRSHDDGSSTVRFKIETASPRWLKEMATKHGLEWGDGTMVELRMNMFTSHGK
jgi:hypothetical protein